MAWPAVANAIAGRLARRSDLADRLVGVAAGIVPPRAVLAPGFLWSLLIGVRRTLTLRLE